jgi:ornithine carbamoyltransferase
MADLLTIREHFEVLEGVKLAYIGDGNNVARSLVVACVRLGLRFAIASPEKYALEKRFAEQWAAQAKPGQLLCCVDPREALQGADVVYTDTWTSMGQEDQKQQRINDFAGYQINRQLLDAVDRPVKVMHCLPAYRGLEITDEVIESEQSIVFDQAENRLHFQRALLKYLCV